MKIPNSMDFRKEFVLILVKLFSSELRKYRDGGSDLIRQIYFTVCRSITLYMSTEPNFQMKASTLMSSK